MGRSQGIAQTIRQPQKGDLILCNWTSYVDVLYLAFRYASFPSTAHSLPLLLLV